ncbi:hypothetical protein ALC57_02742 [Trachymyrmex cornetzi]|uniref:Uncharacterized protein n=1 Tax=Trachymyrmex cornetzi TaxID=471704 RepID=A0A151JNT3_9HYME|nr:hypothetical protein ALC57_02742 [Trachymyrmex cornetzi]
MNTGRRTDTCDPMPDPEDRCASSRDPEFFPYLDRKVRSYRGASHHAGSVGAESVGRYLRAGGYGPAPHRRAPSRAERRNFQKVPSPAPLPSPPTGRNRDRVVPRRSASFRGAGRLSRLSRLFRPFQRTTGGFVTNLSFRVLGDTIRRRVVRYDDDRPSSK